MVMKSWRQLLGSKRRAVRRGSTCLETLENRTVPTVVAVFNTGTAVLTITADGDDAGTPADLTDDTPDDVTVAGTGGSGVDVEDQNGPVSIIDENGDPSFPLEADLNAIVITASGIFGNTINVTGVNASDFTSLASLTVNAGAGNDTVEGSDDFGDVLNGGTGNDKICGGGGDDKITGGGGNDTLEGDAGNDTIRGQAGDDLIDGGDNDDLLDGGAGKDTLQGGSSDAGNDKLDGGDQADLLVGGDGNDTINGGNNDDSINGQAGDDLLNGNQGNDKLLGGDGQDVMFGGNGFDTMSGGDGDDTLHGQGGNDRIFGDAGNDSIFGDAGSDVLVGGDDNDTLLGGDGNDVVSGGLGDDSVDGQGGTDVVQGGSGFGKDALDVVIGPSSEKKETKNLHLDDFDVSTFFFGEFKDYVDVAVTCP